MAYTTAHTLFVISILLLSSTIADSAVAQGRLGRGRLGAGTAKLGHRADPKVLRFEQQLLAAVNKFRATKRLDPLPMDETLRQFAREQAELGARGDPKAKQAPQRVESMKLAPHGFRLQYAFGTRASAVLADLRKDESTTTALLTELGRIGIGAFWVPVDQPYFQVTVLVAREPDPMAGKPGLAREQTDLVMDRVAGRIKQACYDRALERNPNLHGSLIFRVIIGKGGKVDDVSLLSRIGDNSFEACAVQLVREAKFPAPYKGKPVTLNHPMTFTPPQGDKRIGKLSSGQVARVFGNEHLQWQACYEERVKERPRLKGTLRLRLVVDPAGRVKTVDIVGDGLNDELLRDCVLERARELRFPRPQFGADATVEFPLHFKGVPEARR